MPAWFRSIRSWKESVCTLIVFDYLYPGRAVFPHPAFRFSSQHGMRFLPTCLKERKSCQSYNESWERIFFMESEISTGNVFEDLGLPDTDELLVKSGLAMKINTMIESRKLTQKQAAIMLEIPQPKVSIDSAWKVVRLFA
jgi:predicted XRE-type DNA-binding protein